MLNTVNTLTAALLAVLALWALIVKKRPETPLPRWEKTLLWCLILILTALRLWRFGLIPGGMNQDGAMAAVDALALTHYGTDRFGTWLPAHFTAWGYGQMSVLLSYCMVPFIRIFGLSALTARLPVLLWSIGGMAAAYVFLREAHAQRAALAGLLFLAVNPWHFMQSRWALDCNLFPHLFLIGFALLYLGRRKPWAMYLSMLPFALCMYCYGVSFLMVPLFLVLAALVLRVPIKTVLLCAALYLAVAWPIYGTMLINAMGWDGLALPFVTLPYFPGSVRSNDILFFSPDIPTQLGHNLRAVWRVGFLQAPDFIWNAIDGFGTVYRCSLPLLALGLIRCGLRAVREEDAAARLLLVYWLSALFLGACVNGVNINRLNILHYANILLIVEGIEALLSAHRAAAAALLLSYGLLAGLFFTAYFGPWAEQMESVFFADFINAAEWAGELDCDEYYITPDTQYNGSAHVSEILTMFAMQIDAHYFQGITNDPIPYAARFHYRNPDWDALAEKSSVACVVRSEAEAPEGWTCQRFKSYCVFFKEERP